MALNKTLIKLGFIQCRTQREVAEWIYDKEYNSINLQPFRNHRDQLIEDGVLEKDDASRNTSYWLSEEINHSEYCSLNILEKSKYLVRTYDNTKLTLSSKYTVETTLQDIVNDALKNLRTELQDQSFCTKN